MKINEDNAHLVANFHLVLGIVLGILIGLFLWWA